MARGTWLRPCLFRLQACHGEIDLVEMINGAGSVQSHYHYSTNATWCTSSLPGSIPALLTVLGTVLGVLRVWMHGRRVLASSCPRLTVAGSLLTS